MTAIKIAITLDRELLESVDALVRARQYRSRSQAIQSAVRDKLERLRRNRLAREAAKLSPAEERALAEEGLSADAGQWPAY